MLLSLLISSALAAEPSADADHTKAVRKFLAEHLTVGPLRITTITSNQYNQVTAASSVDTWTVYKGMNTLITAKDFAGVTKDDAMLAKMKQQTTTGLAIGIPVTVVGAGVAAYGFSLLGTLDHHLSQMGTAFGASFGGTAVAAVGLLVATGPGRKQTWAVNYYSEDEAQGRAEDYNTQLAADLGVTKADLDTYIKEHSSIELEVHPMFAGNTVGVTGTF